MTSWRKLERSLDSRVNRLFGETVRHSPQKSGKSDPSRVISDIRAVLHFGGDDSFSAGTGLRARLNAGEAELVLNRADHPDLKILPGDLIRATDRQNEWFEVKSISDRYSGLIVASLNQA